MRTTAASRLAVQRETQWVSGGLGLTASPSPLKWPQESPFLVWVTMSRQTNYAPLTAEHGVVIVLSSRLESTLRIRDAALHSAVTLRRDGKLAKRIV